MDGKTGLVAALLAGALIIGVAAYWHYSDDLPKITLVKVVDASERMKRSAKPAPAASPAPASATTTTTVIVDQATPAIAAPGPTPPPELARAPRTTRRGRIQTAIPAPQGGWAVAVPAGGAISPELARTALAFVGTDPDAARVWVAAINDPSRPASERQDLIEDLNETGFVDPNNLTIDDLPLIQARIMIIQRLSPNAMDQTNADAFAEANKDLWNMMAPLTGR